MPVDITIDIKASGLNAYQLWLAEAVANSPLVGLPVVNDQARAKLADGQTYYIFWQMYGSPGGALTFEVKPKAGAPLVSLKESKIPKNDVFQAGVRKFKA